MCVWIHGRNHFKHIQIGGNHLHQFSCVLNRVLAMYKVPLWVRFWCEGKPDFKIFVSHKSIEWPSASLCIVVPSLFYNFKSVREDFSLIPVTFPGSAYFTWSLLLSGGDCEFVWIESCVSAPNNLIWVVCACIGIALSPSIAYGEWCWH